MELSFNGEEVTPNLNKLASEGMFFSNFYSPVSVGTSSDAELMFNTSLLPTKMVQPLYLIPIEHTTQHQDY